jgi:hypothetical protein
VRAGSETTARTTSNSSRGGVIEPKATTGVGRSSIQIAAADVKKLGAGAAVERLVADGTSRLTAERIVAIEQGLAEPGRARPHVTSRR